MANIGFIGLGNMGRPMVANLLKHGHQVMVYDIAADVMAETVALGAKSADLAQLAKFAEVIFTMLQSGEQVAEVCLNEDGLFAHAKPGTLFIDCSSIDVKMSRNLHELAEEDGFEMIDAPVSGGVAGANNASLTVMVGGSQTAFAKAKPYLECIGKTIIHAGEAGNGQVAKICNNMILGISMIGVSEAFSLGEKLGLAPDKLFEISSKASGQCWAMTSYSPVPGLVDGVPSNNDYTPGFTAQMMLKDLRLSQEAAQTAQAATPLGAEATALYALYVGQGAGALDFSGIYRFITGN